MSDAPEGPGWWMADDRKWYPPQAREGADTAPPVEPDPEPPTAHEEPPTAVQDPVTLQGPVARQDATVVAPIAAAPISATPISAAPSNPSPTPAPAQPGPPAASGRGPVIALVVVAVVAVAAAGVAFGMLVGRDDTDDVATVSAETPPTLAAADPASGDPDTPATAPSTTERPTTTAPSTTAAPTTTTSFSNPSIGGGEWIVVLASVQTSSGRAAAQERLDQVRSIAPGADMLLSDDFASLRPGYWVAYLTGYATPESTLDQCRRFGLSVPDDCYGRFLSDDPADIDRVAR